MDAYPLHLSVNYYHEDLHRPNNTSLIYRCGRYVLHWFKFSPVVPICRYIPSWVCGNKIYVLHVVNHISIQSIWMNYFSNCSWYRPKEKEKLLPRRFRWFSTYTMPWGAIHVQHTVKQWELRSGRSPGVWLIHINGPLNSYQDLCY